MSRRTVVLVGIVLGVFASAGATAVSRAPTVERPAAEQEAPAATPVASATSSRSSHQSGHSEGDRPARSSHPVTERHEFHGTGSVVVVSGTVAQGTRTGGGHASVVGPKRPPRP